VSRAASELPERLSSGQTPAPDAAAAAPDESGSFSYRLLRSLGRGSLGETFLAEREGEGSPGEIFVFKCLLDAMERWPEIAAILPQEARLAASLHHPNIAPVHDFGVAGATFYLAREHVPGQDLGAIGRQLRALGRSMPAEIAVRVGVDLCAALSHAHTRMDAGSGRAMVHGGVSPANVVVSDAGAIKLLDFGIAKSLWQLPAGARPNRADVQPFVAPEQLWSEPVDPRTDLFNLGMLLHLLLSGAHPFRRANPAESRQAILNDDPPDLLSLRPDLPASLVNLVRRTLERNRDRRPASAAELGSALRAELSQLTPGTTSLEVARFVSELTAAPAPAAPPPAVPAPAAPSSPSVVPAPAAPSKAAPAAPAAAGPTPPSIVVTPALVVAWPTELTTEPAPVTPPPDAPQPDARAVTWPSAPAPAAATVPPAADAPSPAAWPLAVATDAAPLLPAASAPPPVAWPPAVATAPLPLQPAAGVVATAPLPQLPAAGQSPAAGEELAWAPPLPHTPTPIVEPVADAEVAAALRSAHPPWAPDGQTTHTHGIPLRVLRRRLRRTRPRVVVAALVTVVVVTLAGILLRRRPAEDLAEGPPLATAPVPTVPPQPTVPPEATVPPRPTSPASPSLSPPPPPPPLPPAVAEERNVPAEPVDDWKAFAPPGGQERGVFDLTEPGGPYQGRDLGRVVRGARRKFGLCLKRHGDSTVKSRGELTLFLRVGSGGRVLAADVNLVSVDDEPLATCLEREALRLRFPPHADKDLRFFLPVLFRKR
jgi:serine/threonine protein kinase